MKRVGYDADTQRYTFRDRDGSLWEGGEGADFGELRKGIDMPRRNHEYARLRELFSRFATKQAGHKAGKGWRLRP
jgi:hypothetical protein